MATGKYMTVEILHIYGTVNVNMSRKHIHNKNYQYELMNIIWGYVNYEM